ncbi:cell wall-associated NlpC family hydrolase [Kitasatospora sp. MAP12-15]|uniref:transglycosylase family protein n=1 Tax=unclassified Kitasatospora TaxID=2633591 RepID=UPI002475CC99|nr:transglycosylase family protein [Kitasatospora sp. MAP12-44]MDH6109123.1 cell wall-associated NlpC family hydrolase [Kitasatospora sp. MAP12-44]
MLPITSSKSSTRTRRVIAATGLVGLGLSLPCITATTASAATVSTWDKVAQCESSGDWSINTGNGFYGGLQFTSSTWAAFGGTQYAPEANQATKDQQIAVAEKVLASQGPGAWPVCSIQAGLTAGGPAPAINTGTSAPAAATPAPAAPAPATAAPAASGQNTASQHSGWHQDAAAGADSSYTVAAGDWLSSIAQSHDVQGGWEHLYELNKSVLTHGPDTIYPGQKLSLGGSTATASWSHGNWGHSDNSGTTAPAQTPAPATAATTTSAKTPAPAATGSMAAAVAFAESKVGQAYIYGGTGNGGWDCSGLTQAALAQAGISIPRVAADQAAASTHVSLDALQPGDLLFWSNNGADSGVYHVGIYVGNGSYVEAANPSVGVHMETIANWAPDFAGRV